MPTERSTTFTLARTHSMDAILAGALERDTELPPAARQSVLDAIAEVLPDVFGLGVGGLVDQLTGAAGAGIMSCSGNVCDGHTDGPTGPDCPSESQCETESCDTESCAGVHTCGSQSCGTESCTGTHTCSSHSGVTSVVESAAWEIVQRRLLTIAEQPEAVAAMTIRFASLGR